MVDPPEGFESWLTLVDCDRTCYYFLVSEVFLEASTSHRIVPGVESVESVKHINERVMAHASRSKWKGCIGKRISVMPRQTGCRGMRRSEERTSCFQMVTWGQSRAEKRDGKMGVKGDLGGVKGKRRKALKYINMERSSRVGFVCVWVGFKSFDIHRQREHFATTKTATEELYIDMGDALVGNRSRKCILAKCSR